MNSRRLILDFSEFDLSAVVADLHAIRRYNPQRHEMEQMTAIVLDDPQRGVCVGYKDCPPTEFWIRGHFPFLPVFPAMLMCEAAAQCCGYFVQRHELVGGGILGFAGIDKARFYGPVFAGERLTIVVQLLRVRRGALLVCRFQELVGERLVCEGTIKGRPLPTEVATPQAPGT